MQAQAAQWFARLQSKDCSDAERRASWRWRAQSPAHEAAFRRTEALWQQCLGIRADPALAEGLRQVERGDRWRTRQGRYWPRLLAAAAVVGVLSLLAPRLWQAAEPPVRYQTAIGEQRTVALPDGSIVVLDTSTTMMARYTGKFRQISLETGQASFNVTRDTSRPFHVQAAGGSVTALGTEFVVRVEPAAGAAAVTLLAGRVRVEAPSVGGSQRHAPATLAAGQQIRYGQAGQWVTTQVDLEVATAWIRGSVHAEDWRLADLLSEMNRYSSTQLLLADPGLSELRITGVFRTGDPRSLQRVLEHNLRVQAQPGPGNAILLTRRPSAQ